jgi:hypothetical protein
MNCYAVPKVVNYGVLYWVSGCESWCIIRSQWLWIKVRFTVPVVVNDGVLCWVNGCELCCAMLVNHGELCWASGCESWFAMLCQWLSHGELCCARVWNMVCYAELVVVNHAVLYWSEWLWVMVCNAEPVVVKHGVLCWASGCEFMCAIVNRTIVNHVVLYWADCDLVMVCHAEPLDMNDMSHWLWIMTCYGGPVVVNHGV